MLPFRDLVYPVSDTARRLGKLPGMFIAITLFFSACLKNMDNTDSGPKAGLSVTNLVLNADPVDIYVNETKVNTTALTFGSTTGNSMNPYIPVAAGTHTLQVNAAVQTVLQKNVSLQAAKRYSLYLFDTLKNNNVRVILLSDDTTSTDTLARVRFLHFVPGRDTLSAILYSGTSGFQVTDTYFGNYNLPDAEVPFSIRVRPGDYRIELRNRNKLLFEQASYTLKAGKLYTFLARGATGGTGNYKESITIIQHN